MRLLVLHHFTDFVICLAVLDRCFLALISVFSQTFLEAIFDLENSIYISFQYFTCVIFVIFYQLMEFVNGVNCNTAIPAVSKKPDMSADTPVRGQGCLHTGCPRTGVSAGRNFCRK